jgi:hypothetical protein
MSLDCIALYSEEARLRQIEISEKLSKSKTKLWCRLCGGIDGVDLEENCPCVDPPMNHFSGELELLIKVK